MNPRDEIKVTFKAVSDREGEYVAYYRSEFLNATFSVYFRDTIFGAIALHDFTEMLKGKYEKGEDRICGVGGADAVQEQGFA